MPSVFPSNRTGSIPGPGLYAKVQTAVAPRVLNPSSRRFKPSCGKITESAFPRPLGAASHTFMAHFGHKVFDIRSWKTIKCMKAERGVLGDARAADLR